MNSMMLILKNKWRKFHQVQILFLFLMVFLPVCAQHPSVLIPEFKFFRLNGQPFTDRNLEMGKLSFFIFFDVTCDHCQRAIQQINQHYKECGKAAVYLISLDSQVDIKKFINDYGPALTGEKNVTLLQDRQNEFIRKFGPRKYPSLFLYSSRKKLLLYDDNEENMFRFINRVR